MKKGEELIVEQHGIDLPERMWQSLTDIIQRVLNRRSWLRRMYRSSDGRDHRAEFVRMPTKDELQLLVNELDVGTSVLPFSVKVELSLEGKKEKPPQRSQKEMVERGIDGLIEDIRNGGDPLYMNRGLRAIIFDLGVEAPILKLAKAVKKVLDK